MVSLKELLDGFTDTKKIPNIEITGMTHDSRLAESGSLFAALEGESHDGHDYIPEAIEQGAAAILGSHPIEDLSVPYIRLDSLRPQLGQIAARCYGEPTQQLPLIGITGTNGKTTCTYLIESILKAADQRPAILGTINYRFEGQSTMASHTTPEAIDLQRWLAQARDAGADGFVMEVSSHGIDLDRVTACHFDTVLFTNLSQDHLDYHGDMESYFQAKARLFRELLPKSGKTHKHAVINWEDPYAQRLADLPGIETVRCGWDSDLDYQVTHNTFNEEGIRAEILTPEGPITVASPLLGRLNLQNILLASAACHVMGIGRPEIERGIQEMSGVPGRLEKVANDHGLHVIVDYAHTPDALRRVLETLRALAQKRIITVFGCGGDRDSGKRPLMGHAAARLSDVVIVTSDNPRTEDPEQIIEQILPGIRAEHSPEFRNGVGRGYLIEPDRQAAIEQAIQLARGGDLILIAGKGHEDYQILGRKKHAFDDRQVARKAMEQLL